MHQRIPDKIPYRFKAIIFEIKFSKGMTTRAESNNVFEKLCSVSNYCVIYIEYVDDEGMYY